MSFFVMQKYPSLNKLADGFDEQVKRWEAAHPGCRVVGFGAGEGRSIVYYSTGSKFVYVATDFEAFAGLPEPDADAPVIVPAAK